jgi:hypothetical protein
LIIALKIVLTLFLLSIAWQDFKWRAVWWFLFPLALGLQSLLALKQIYWSTWAIYFAINLFIVAFQLLVLISYLKLVKRLNPSQLFKAYLGLGDVLFFIVLAAAFSPLNFLFFLLCFLLVSLIVALYFKRVLKTVPLAGILALAYGSVLWFSLVINNFNVYSDLLIHFP